MVAVPEFINPEPENTSPQGAEAQKGSDAQATNSLQRDGQFDSINLGDLDNVFSGQDSTSDSLPDFAFKDDSSSISDQISSMTTEELDKAISEQRAYVTSIENQLKGVNNAADAAGLKQQADKMAEADAYFATT